MIRGTTASAYPLCWPEGLPRTQARQTSQFKTSLAGALKNVRTSLDMFGRDSGKKVSDVVLSSNVTLGNDRPADPGVAVWFVWEDAQRCIAVDRYPKAEENLQAIHHILEARRTEMRHGGLHIVRQTFRGFVALPPPDASNRPDWRVVLDITEPTTVDRVEAAYRKKAMVMHPDAGGDREGWDELQYAYEQAKEAVA